jgi:D-sedoheptulose 7-phosphate isomerase
VTAGGGVESLYPFLYGGGPGAAVLDDIERSTAEKLTGCAAALARSFAAGGRLLAFGNGGSSTDAADLATLFLNPGAPHRPLPALSLTSDIALVTALGNDVGFDVVFARQIAVLGRPGDVAVGLSTSGNSANAVRAFAEATSGGLLTVGFAGHDGGQFAQLESLDYLFVVPSPSVHRIQESQATLYHALWSLTQDALEEVAPRT